MENNINFYSAETFKTLTFHTKDQTVYFPGSIWMNSRTQYREDENEIKIDCASADLVIVFKILINPKLIENLLNDENIFRIFKITSEFSLGTMWIGCMKYIPKNINGISKQHGWLQTIKFMVDNAPCLNNHEELVKYYVDTFEEHLKDPEIKQLRIEDLHMASGFNDKLHTRLLEKIVFESKTSSGIDNLIEKSLSNGIFERNLDLLESLCDMTTNYIVLQKVINKLVGLVKK